MQEDLIILDGSTFFSTRENGDVEVEGSQGYFYLDVRHLTRWTLTVDGQEIAPLSSGCVDYFSARIVGTPAGSEGDRPPLAVRRDRFVSEGVHEDVVVENLGDRRRQVRVELAFGSDFADAMEAQSGANGEGRLWQEAHARSVRLWNEREGYRRGTIVTFNRAGRVTSDRATFDLALEPGDAWSLCVDITPVVEGKRRPPLLRCESFGRHAPKMPMSLEEWLEDAPELVTDNPGVARTYEQSLLDLAALRLRPEELAIRWAMPGGGLPWYMTVFGRDALLAAYETLPFHQEFARATLEALAELQATEWDNWRDAEPGKILHELRRGTLAALGRIPHTPYYGAHDSTPLFLVLLDEYERWSGDGDFVRRLEPNARAALAWLEGPADLDGDGYIEYRKRSKAEMALDNHCWRDSDGSIVFADGGLAEPPIATAEQQGLAYDARLRFARLAREIWEDEETAVRLEDEAAALKRRFNRDFWHSARRHYVLALDGEKRQVDALSSDVGHLLWSGIADETKAKATVRRLLGEDLFTGWGIRSLSSETAGYHPLGYHDGTVWPHDTAIVAEGMRRYGFGDEAAFVCEALLDAAGAFGGRLPEVFAGFARDAAKMPVEYPGALKPQSWAAGAPLLVLRTLLGLDVVDGRVRSSASLPDSIGVLRLRRVGVRGRYVDL